MTIRTGSAPRILAVAVLTVALAAAAAPAAAAQPGPAATFDTPSWGLQALFDRVHGVVAGWLGGVGEGADVERIAGQAGHSLEPDGVQQMSDSPTLELEESSASPSASS